MQLSHSQELNLTILTPEKLLFQGDVSMVVLPGLEGEFGVLPGHAPFATSLKEGDIKIYREKDKVETLQVTGGFADINTNGCKVLV